jgi:hypothetical protein
MNAEKVMSEAQLWDRSEGTGVDGMGDVRGVGGVGGVGGGEVGVVEDEGGLVSVVWGWGNGRRKQVGSVESRRVRIGDDDSRGQM